MLRSTSMVLVVLTTILGCRASPYHNGVAVESGPHIKTRHYELSRPDRNHDGFNSQKPQLLIRNYKTAEIIFPLDYEPCSQTDSTKSTLKLISKLFGIDPKLQQKSPGRHSNQETTGRKRKVGSDCNCKPKIDDDHDLVDEGDDTDVNIADSTQKLEDKDDDMDDKEKQHLVSENKAEKELLENDEGKTESDVNNHESSPDGDDKCSGSECQIVEANKTAGDGKQDISSESLDALDVITTDGSSEDCDDNKEQPSLLVGCDDDENISESEENEDYATAEKDIGNDDEPEIVDHWEDLKESEEDKSVIEEHAVTSEESKELPDGDEWVLSKSEGSEESKQEIDEIFTSESEQSHDSSQEIERILPDIEDSTGSTKSDEPDEYIDEYVIEDENKDCDCGAKKFHGDYDYTSQIMQNPKILLLPSKHQKVATNSRSLASLKENWEKFKTLVSESNQQTWESFKEKLAAFQDQWGQGDKGRTTESPNTTESPQTTTESPETTTESPQTTNESPQTTNESPQTTNEPPQTTNESPQTSSESQEEIHTTTVPSTTSAPAVTLPNDGPTLAPLAARRFAGGLLGHHKLIPGHHHVGSILHPGQHRNKLLSGRPFARL